MPEVVSRFAIQPLIPAWTDDTKWHNWEKHEALLRSKPNWKPHQIDSVRTESLRIISKTVPVNREVFQCRGLVVGYVQSGKTANYTAVAARAADVGYRLIIVLSGIHDSLREQTQIRLDRELVQIGTNWITLTDNDNDFTIPPNPDGFTNDLTVLVVAKKIVPVLKRIADWLTIIGGRLSDIPVLVIDDEADQASVNTKGNRKDTAIDDPSIPEDKANPDTAPTQTNLLIRTILNLCPRATYIAYTATPFANLLINPDALDIEVGEDLFPRDFIVQLPRPDGYTGTEELFGTASVDRNVLRSVADEDVIQLKPGRRKKGSQIQVRGDVQLPQSLCDALLAFCIAGGIRILRGITNQPHTMLVHISHEQKEQIRIGEAISNQLRAWRVSEDVSPGSMRNTYRSAMIDFGKVDLPGGIDIEDVITQAIFVLKTMEEVTVLNSSTGENLCYEERPNCHLVAVGGNRLSRGLTLEGLTVAYFLRTATTVDSLLQMCRWYGFRSGYGDLIRIWTTDGIADWFIELATVEQSLRDSILRLDRAGKRPDQMQVAIRAHSHLKLTNTAKSRMAEETGQTWSGQCPQTILLPISNHEALKSNESLTSQLIMRYPPSASRYGGHLAFDIPSSVIIQYLRDYQSHPDAISFNSGSLADWIAERSMAGELIRWTVFVASPANPRQVQLGDCSFGLVYRSPSGTSGIGILVDPKHEGVDLEGGPDLFQRGKTYNTQAMRGNRQSSNGLLLIYPLDPMPFMAPSESVIALAASLPCTSDEEALFLVNRGVPRE